MSIQFKMLRFHILGHPTAIIKVLNFVVGSGTILGPKNFFGILRANLLNFTSSAFVIVHVSKPYIIDLNTVLPILDNHREILVILLRVKMNLNILDDIPVLKIDEKVEEELQVENDIYWYPLQEAKFVNEVDLVIAIQHKMMRN